MRLDFICVGFGRSGTRWLCNCLSEHPQVSIPKILREIEPNYFPEEYELMGLKNYEALFSEADFSKLVGEVSCTPIMHKETASLLKKLFPRVKVIICQRDEEKRKKSYENVSKHVMLKEQEYKKIDQEQYISPFRKHFKENLFIFNMGEKDRQKGLNRLFRFLGVDEFTPHSIYTKNAKTGVGFKPTAHPKTRILVSHIIRPTLRKNLKLYYFLKRKLRLDVYYQRLHSNL